MSLHNGSTPDGTWYKQPTTGPTPDPRIDFCLALASSSDGSSHNLYMYGGRGLNGSKPVFYDEIWVLSLPSFTWIKIYSGTSPRYGHSCHRVGERTLITVGGAENTNYTNLPCDWETRGVGVYDLSTLTWGSVFDPNKGNYTVPDSVVETIGGSGTGGANLTQPQGGFAHPDLEAIFKSPWTKDGSVDNDGNSQEPISDTMNPAAPKTNSTTYPISNLSYMRKNMAAIVAGVTVGCVAALACAVGAGWYYRRIIISFLLGRELLFPFLELGEGREKPQLELPADKGDGKAGAWELGGWQKPAEMEGGSSRLFSGEGRGDRKIVEIGGSGGEGVVELESPSERGSVKRNSGGMGRDKPLPMLVREESGEKGEKWRNKPLPSVLEKPLPVLKVEGEVVEVWSPSNSASAGSERSNHDRSWRRGGWDSGGTRRDVRGMLEVLDEMNWI